VVREIKSTVDQWAEAALIALENEELKRLRREEDGLQKKIEDLQKTSNQWGVELEKRAEEAKKILGEYEKFKAEIEKEREELIRKRTVLLQFPERSNLLLQRRKDVRRQDLFISCTEGKEVYFNYQDFCLVCDSLHNDSRAAMKPLEKRKCADGEERFEFPLDYHEKTLRLLHDYLYNDLRFIEVSVDELIELYLLSDELLIVALKEICQHEIKTLVEQGKFSLRTLFEMAPDIRFSFLKGTYEEWLVQKFVQAKYENLSDLSNVDLSSLDYSKVRDLLNAYWCSLDDEYYSGVQKFYVLIQWAIQVKQRSDVQGDEKEKFPNATNMSVDKQFEVLLRNVQLPTLSYQDYAQVLELVKKIYGEASEREVRLHCELFLIDECPMQAMLNFLPFSVGNRERFSRRIIHEIAICDVDSMEQNTFFGTDRELKLSHLSLEDILDLISNLDDLSEARRDYFALRLIMNWVFGTLFFNRWKNSFPNEQERDAYIEEKKKLLSTSFEGKNGAQVQIWDFVNFDQIPDNMVFVFFFQLTLFFPNETGSLTGWQNALCNMSKESRKRLGENHPRHKR
jgi:hypothetical protein